MVLYAFWFHAEAQSFPQRRKGIQRKVGGRIKGFVEGRCSLLFVFTQRRKGRKGRHAEKKAQIRLHAESGCIASLLVSRRGAKAQRKAENCGQSPWRHGLGRGRIYEIL